MLRAVLDDQPQRQEQDLGGLKAETNESSRRNYPPNLGQTLSGAACMGLTRRAPSLV